MDFSFVSNGIISILENILLIDIDLDASKSIEIVEFEFCELEQDRSNVIVDINNIVFMNLFLVLSILRLRMISNHPQQNLIFPWTIIVLITTPLTMRK